MSEKVALITGGLQGIGLAIVERLLADGFSCVVADKNINQISSAEHIDKASCRYFSCDISVEEDVRRLFGFINNSFGRLDVLVNNAGILSDSVIWKMDLSAFEKVMDVNLKGTWLMCREAASIMKEQKFGRIVNIASRAWLGNPGQSNYAASKAGVVALTRVLALELGRYNVLVNAVAPGLIDTPLVQGLSTEAREKLIQAQPGRTIGKPDDVAHLVSFLCDNRTRFITGQTMYVDGGKSIGAGI